MTYKIAALLILFVSVNLSAQSWKRTLRGFGLEVGLGSNELIMRDNNSEYRRDNFSFAPSARIFYEFKLIKLLGVKPFVGYVKYGGESRVEPNGYEDRINFHAVEYGAFVIVNLRVLGLRGSVGAKGKYFFSANQSAYGSVLDPPGTQREWVESDPSFLYKKSSFNLGLRIDQGIGTIGFGVEAWFGISDLGSEESFSGTDVSIYENHYRMVFSIRL